MSDVGNDLEEIEKKYGHLLVVGTGVLLIIAVLISAFISHWFALRLQSDFWPVDKSTVGPNILASAIQAVIVVVIMALFYPPFRKALDKAATNHKNEIKQHITNELSEVHAKMDHIIKNHPNIPNYKKETK